MVDSPAAVRPLAAVAREAKAGTASPEELLTSFVRSRLYLPRPPRPGVPTMVVKGHKVVPVFTSEAELARFAGRCDWFCTDGLDLLGLVPPGVVVGLDLASAHRLQLDPGAVRLDYVLRVGAARPSAAGDTAPGCDGDRGPARTIEEDRSP